MPCFHNEYYFNGSRYLNYGSAVAAVNVRDYHAAILIHHERPMYRMADRYIMTVGTRNANLVILTLYIEEGLLQIEGYMPRVNRYISDDACILDDIVYMMTHGRR